MSDDKRVIKRALISLSDKTGLLELAKALTDAGVEIVSTGSTASTIAAAGMPVTQVQDLTGFPECLDGRVKTLHPKVHGGLLADVRLDSHVQQLKDLEIEPFQLAVINLYPFTETVASGASANECVEQIDIGGPAMVRASAKNHANMAIVVSPARYAEVIAAIGAGGFTLDQRKRLAAEAFQHTATYDVNVASWISSVVSSTDEGTGFPNWIGVTYNREDVLRYGENPHQKSAVYTAGIGEVAIAGAKQIHGKQMSYNNYVDADAARRAAFDFSEPAVAIIKHSNPCGIAVGKDVADAHRKAHETDPVSAFGGVIAANRKVTAEMARQVAEIFTEVIVAPEFDDEALAILSAKPSIRILVVPPTKIGEGIEMRNIDGGVLLQVQDKLQADGDKFENWQLVTGDAVDDQTKKDLQFAWIACRSVKSNAILLAKDEAAVGIGMGQVSRVDSAGLAVKRAGERVVGSVASSDAFFPFADGLEVLVKAGVKAVVQPGGSVRDEEVISVAKAAGISMYFTSTRHFFH
ncbi:MAG: bifunctional phosphoribosylaminoimidazolecarboxamide formyltransferase/IMP cyclohydrolase [Actinobacteria bacterium]|nr:bifunctional phosphoribosylaminoimidazolecarboxamide formyltransferase/IMP cyclohydrolase [Actinomycetota bacterium]